MTDNNPSQPHDNNQSEPINKENNIASPSINLPKQESPKQESSKPESSKPELSKPESSKPESSKPESSKPESSKQELSKPESSKQELSKPESSKPKENNKNIPKTENIPKDNISTLKPPLISKHISKSNPSLNSSIKSINKPQNSKNENEILKESFLHLSSMRLDDNISNSKKSLNVLSIKKNLSSSVTNINTNMHNNDFNKGYKSYTNLSIDEDKQSVLYNISPTLTHGELHKKIDTQNSTYSEQISSLKNTYIITRHNSIDTRRDKENKRNSLIKKSNDSVSSSNKQKALSISNRSSVITPINVLNDSSSPNNKASSLSNLDTNNEEHNNELRSENSTNTITKAICINSSTGDTTKEIEKLKSIIVEKTDEFFDVGKIGNNNETNNSQKSKSSNSLKNDSHDSVVLSSSNNKNAKTILESTTLNHGTSVCDKKITFITAESNEGISLTPKNDSKSKLTDIPKSSFSSFEFDDDDNDFNGPLLTLPQENTSNFSHNYLNNIKQNNYSSTLNIDDDDFLSPSTERKPANLERLQSLFTNDDSSIETKTGSKTEGMRNNKSASLSKVANDYLNEMNDFETWDDDFDGDFSIPDTVVNSQKILKQEIISFKSFAVNIEGN
ncbi:hypothetical protein PIROE2DRAFT_58537 [Piromyces sp. E2]|nr:hypothetical protein PIROE2DRAFT_58537 [Piromyces sp. E2]|eukprot:OUM67738.1 hypothetical protein PIROE2DRAFT_58537 [Piromyces sp. E2]